MKKSVKKLLKNQPNKYEYFYLEFVDGDTVRVPVNITGGKTAQYDAFLAQINSRKGAIPSENGRTYQMHDLIHYEIKAN